MIQTLEEALKKINELDQKNKQLEAELEKYKNRAYAGRKKHDSAWMQSYNAFVVQYENCLLYTSPSPRDRSVSRMPSSA